MKNHGIHALLEVMFLVGASSLVACVARPTDGAEGSSDGSSASGAVDSTSNSGPVDSTRGSEGADGTTGTSSSDGADDPSPSSSGEDGGLPFEFPDEPYDVYTQLDRHGAVEAGTVGILASEGLGFNPGSDISLRDAYNASSPLEDAGGLWLDEIVESVTFFHDALDDDLTGFGLTVASVNDAIQQAGPVLVPDTIKYDPSQPTAFPNGRRLEDPVVDILLAAVLLDLSVHPLDLFATLPLNPPANDVELGAEFPYLAAPHDP